MPDAEISADVANNGEECVAEIGLLEIQLGPVWELDGQLLARSREDY